MEQLRIFFVDFWESFDNKDNFFWNTLSRHYDLTLDEKNPEILFYSFAGLNDISQKHFHKFDCIRIFYTGENIRPNFNECDFSLSYEYMDDKRNLRLPIYVLYNDQDKLLHRKVDPWLLKIKTRFCCFVVSNPKNKVRNEFFKSLSKYKKVDSGGLYLNNIGTPVKDKIKFMKDYKFVISFENESHPGYVTEKVYEPKLADAIPIYWGDPLVGNDFNAKSFINCHEFKSMDEVIERIIELDNNDELYMKYATEPFFVNDSPTPYVQENYLMDFLKFIIDHRHDYKPVASTWKKYYYLYSNPKIMLLKYVRGFKRRL